MLEVKKNNNSESSVSLLRRFKFKTRQSGVLSRAKSIRYKLRPLSKYKRKQMALQKIKIKKQREHLRKLGKIK
ncbi:MAG: hypothetical protein A2909_02825 [Candidatus Tagabacteria bacterium RIFCSPLOWO2_01_FULL_39_11]|uniref:30S ribosomal protein S21 n=1 Tax=Candidatus Tagabacteria bacterium RIFCSPLOWO2_01_FULL_39_11 TaxID=1802295 RepID=A0A1G2LR53_9BACT|nr:MAG: hypothetical protein A2909_02825 [Candidatus Tagabacteria bacterium RIFCSPLOWO2_01_FULL_39_11]